MSPACIFPSHPPGVRVTPVRPSLALAFLPAWVAAQIYYMQVLQEESQTKKLQGQKICKIIKVQDIIFFLQISI